MQVFFIYRSACRISLYDVYMPYKLATTLPSFLHSVLVSFQSCLIWVSIIICVGYVISRSLVIPVMEVIKPVVARYGGTHLSYMPMLPVTKVTQVTQLCSVSTVQ